MINKDFDYYDPVGDVSMCKPNKPMNKMLENAIVFNAKPGEDLPTKENVSVVSFHL